MADMTRLSVEEVRQSFKKKDFTTVELTEAYFKAIRKHEDLNAYVTLNEENALEQAKKCDVEKSSCSADVLPPMHGIPIGLKDLFCTKGLKTTACSKMLEDFIPPYESTIGEKFRAQGAVLLGKLSLDEFAMGSSNETSYFGPVISPWRSQLSPDIPLVPGGSSGGTSAAISAGLALCATGTDTGGSIRQPAAFTGIVGLKPTYGLSSRYGVIGFASSLDVPGPMARTVGDVASMLCAMVGHDPKDSTSIDRPLVPYHETLGKSIQGLRVGLPKEYILGTLNAEILKVYQDTCDALKEAGAEIFDVSLPNTLAALPVYYVVASAEASSNLSRYDGVRFGYRTIKKVKSLDEFYAYTRQEGFGLEVKKRILVGSYVLSSGAYEAYFQRAQKVRRLVQNDFIEVFKKVDVLLTPTTPSTAFELGGSHKNALDMYFNDIFTVPSSLAGVPAISVPCGLSQECLPIGMQLIANFFKEDILLQTASILEKVFKKYDFNPYAYARGFNGKL